MSVTTSETGAEPGNLCSDKLLPGKPLSVTRLSGKALSGTALSGGPRFALCGLALICDAVEIPVDYFSKRQARENTSANPDITHPQIQYGHWGNRRTGSF